MPEGMLRALGVKRDIGKPPGEGDQFVTAHDESLMAEERAAHES